MIRFFLGCVLFVFSCTAIAAEVTLKTTVGDIVIQLDEKNAPVTVRNFVGYVQSGFYTETIFHRVIDGFMIQGGGFNEKLQQKRTQAPIRNESLNGLQNGVGTVAMARTNDQHSATSQFFINLKDNDFLNARGSKYGYAVFGTVVKGMNVVMAIAKQKTHRVGHMNDVPVSAVVIQQAIFTP